MKKKLEKRKVGNCARFFRFFFSRGCYSYNPDHDQRVKGCVVGGAATIVEIPCPQADRFRKRALKKRRERRRRAKAARERRAKEKRAEARRRGRARRSRRRGRSRRRRSRRRSRGRGRGRGRQRRRRRSTRSRRRRGRRSPRGRGREEFPREIDHALGMMANVTDRTAKQQPIPTKNRTGSHLPNDRPHSDHSTISDRSETKQE